jgi:pimeloyl-ACP methyl ester carboxylesterase
LLLLLRTPTPGGVVVVVAAAIARTSPAVMAQRIAAALKIDVRAELGRVRLPALVVEGRADRLLRSLVRGRRRDLQAVTLDAPHLVLEAAPEESARVVAGFLRSVGNPRRA